MVMPMVKSIQNALALQFPHLGFSVFMMTDTLEINYDAYASPGEAHKIEKFVNKLMETKYPYANYILNRMPF